MEEYSRRPYEKFQVSISLGTVIIGFFITYTFLPIASVIVGHTLTTYFYLLMVVFMTMLCLLNKGLLEYKNFILYLIPFLILDLLNFFTSNTSDIVLRAYAAVLFVFPLILGHYIISTQGERIGKYCGLISIIFIITSITTYVGLVVFPGASRTLATGNTGVGNVYIWFNIGGYEFIYTLVLLYPLIILAYKKRKINLIFAIALSIGIFLVVIQSEYTIALLLFIAGTVLYFLNKNMKARGVIVAAAIVLILIFLFRERISLLFLQLSNSVESVDLSQRFRLLGLGYDALSRSDDNRLELYTQSFQLFLKYPILGGAFSGNLNTGNHSFILDTLGKYGLAGGFILLLCYRGIYRLFFREYKEQDGFGFTLWIFAETIILSFVNTTMWLPFLTLIVPIFLRTIFGNHEFDDYYIEEDG